VFSACSRAVSVIGFWLLCQQVNNKKVNNNNNNNNLLRFDTGKFKVLWNRIFTSPVQQLGGQQINGLSLLLQKE